MHGASKSKKETKDSDDIKPHLDVGFYKLHIIMMEIKENYVYKIFQEHPLP